MRLLQEVDDQATELSDVRYLVHAIVQSANFFKQRGEDDNWLFRGMDQSLVPNESFVRILQSRKDRRPKDSTYQVHDALNLRLERDFGIPYRTEGTFCTGDPHTATEYGKSAIILPIGQFDFCWGMQVKDAYAKFDLGQAFNFIAIHAKDKNQDPHGLKYPGVSGGITAFLDFIESNEWAMQLFNQWFDLTYTQGRYSDKNLPDAIESGNEIMIHCEEFAVIPNKELIRSYYIDAAEHLIAGPLEIKRDPNMREFITALSKKVIPALNPQ